MSDTEAELTCMSTDPRLGGRGIGTHMDKDLEKHARKNGFKKMHAMVIREHGRVVEFYERLGYVKKSEELIKPGGTFPNVVEVNVWYMDKDL
jgi:ribosomal protein S18 acetylase RimI-like enzyme